MGMEGLVCSTAFVVAHSIDVVAVCSSLFDAAGAWENARLATDLGIEVSEVACYPSPVDGFANATECKDSG